MYDNGGNILSRTEYAYSPETEVLTSLIPSDTINYSYGNTDWKDQLTSFDGQAITYDAIGNPLSYRGMTLTWQNGRQLATLSKDGLSASYTYNDAGLRLGKTINGTTTEYYWNGTQLLAQKTGITYLYFLYDETGSAVGYKYNNKTYIYVKNLQGDVTSVIDGTTGTSVANYTYDSWGNILTATGTMAEMNPIRYRGYYYDTETSLYYLQSRYYDAQTHRFVNADAFVEIDTVFGNLFVYCDNNPINRCDSSGYFWKELAEAISANIQQAGGVFAFAGIVTQADSPMLGPADALGGLIALTALIVCTTMAFEDVIAAPPIEMPKEKEKDATLDKTKPTQTVIYRYGGTNPGNLTPKPKDRYTSLSFSLIPRPGSAVTTIEAINATGVLFAVQDGPKHVSVIPIGASMNDWIEQGSTSIWTQTLKFLTVKI